MVTGSGTKPWVTCQGGVGSNKKSVSAKPRHDCCKQRTRPKSVLGDVVVLSRNGQSWITTVTASAVIVRAVRRWTPHSQFPSSSLKQPFPSDRPGVVKGAP